MDAHRKILVTGGVRAGKSRYAQERAAGAPGRRVFLATAEASDGEMRARIERHKTERGDLFETVETPVYLAQTLNNFDTLPGIVMIDCLTVWMYNLMHYFKDSETKIDEQCNLFLEAYGRLPCDCIIVTNEVGGGIIPDNALARDYMNRLGFLNQRAAQISTEVILMVSGIPHWLKGKA